MKRPSLVYQAKDILSKAFDNGFGRSKHTDKLAGTSRENLYSRSSYSNALEKCCTFLKYCKETFGTRNLQDIEQGYFTRFVAESKYKTDVADGYKWAVQKLQDGFNALHSESKTWISQDYKGVAVKARQKERVQMPRDIHDKIIDEAYKSKYENGLAFDMARSLGLRVSEITNLRMNDFICNNGILKNVKIFKSKGGRTRTINIEQLSDTGQDFVTKTYQYFTDCRGEKERLFISKAESYSKAFSRARKQVTEEYTQCGVHSLRKEFANDFYQRELEKGRTEKEVKQDLTLLLGHKRIDVLKHYLQ